MVPLVSLKAARSAPPGPAAARYRPLGGFRFGLALMVAAQHFQHLLPPGERRFFSHIGLGIVAVALFFAVSGLVVTEMVFYRGRPGAFLANRLLRLVPPYLAALAMLAVLLAACITLAATPPRPALARTDRALGDLSYPLYLNHYAVGLTLSCITPARGPALYGVGLVLSLALAWLMGRLEAPLRHVRDRLRRTALPLGSDKNLTALLPPAGKLL